MRSCFRVSRLRWRRDRKRGNHRFSHFGPDANLFPELEALFHDYGECGSGQYRKYLHDADEAAPFSQPAGTFSQWEELPRDTDLLYYEGLHGAIADCGVDVARDVDLLVGVVPVINLEWIQPKAGGVASKTDLH